MLLKDVVRDRIRDAIRDGTFRHGEVLRDSDLVEWLGVSRTPIRSALDDLAREGLVETAPNRYTRVAVPRRKDVVSASHALGSLYAAGMRFALPPLTDSYAQRVQEGLKAVVEHVRTRDLDAVIRDFLPQFNGLIAQSSNKIYRDQALRAIDSITFITQVESVYDAGGAHAAVEPFDAAVSDLCAAIAARDIVAAARATEQAFLGWVPDPALS
ncbi:GntR family transcriptional regulator [Leifsonia sp. ZF2019]|uniref:GntR family transcriptional regulator n=1 Tax=Leifsonia sp. ZF2019 TaxID=2781978 RepID=UPI001CBFF087|nr:GntR family transcriptional regulator [Leifsonia sp. ZF2019]